jgi:hypothetical protein
VTWPAEWAFCEVRVIAHKRELDDGSRASIVVQAVDAAQKQRCGERPSRGRKPKYNWTKADRALDVRLDDYGYPEPGDGGQADLEKMVANMFPSDQCPSESVIREHVVKRIEAFRRGLAKPASESCGKTAK